MSILVAFTACRMTELTRMKRKDLKFDDLGMNIETAIKKGKKTKYFTIRLWEKVGIICPVKMMKNWLNDSSCLKGNEDEIWINIETKKPLAP
jgi:integrase